MNTQEIEIIKVLDELKADKAYIALSLSPEFGNSIIANGGNRLFINEGRQGKWSDVSEVFYDSLIDKYDSRYRK
jgi:hypothetical protein